MTLVRGVETAVVQEDPVSARLAQHRRHLTRHIVEDLGDIPRAGPAEICLEACRHGFVWA